MQSCSNFLRSVMRNFVVDCTGQLRARGVLKCPPRQADHDNPILAGTERCSFSYVCIGPLSKYAQVEDASHVELTRRVQRTSINREDWSLQVATIKNIQLLL